MSREAEEMDDVTQAPSDLDEMTHQELRMMHREGAANLLFAKTIQWRTVASTLLVLGALVALVTLTPDNRQFANVMQALIILMCCAAIFVLVMYQMWQFNEICRLRKIDGFFSSLYAQINSLKSSREANAHRYTILLFMIMTVILGGGVSIMSIRQLVIV